MPTARAAPPIEALVADREALIRVLRIALTELNDRRLKTPQLTGEANILERIRYWDRVLDWVTTRQEHDVLLMNRRIPD